MSADDVAGAFVNHYYTTLNNNPAALAGLYVSFYSFIDLAGAFNSCNNLPATTIDIDFRRHKISRT
jgi:hypothetical protein